MRSDAIGRVSISGLTGPIAASAPVDSKRGHEGFEPSRVGQLVIVDEGHVGRARRAGRLGSVSRHGETLSRFVHALDAKRPCLA